MPKRKRKPTKKDILEQMEDMVSQDQLIFIMKQLYVEMLLAYGKAATRLDMEHASGKHLGLMTHLIQQEVGLAPDWEAVKDVIKLNTVEVPNVDS